MDEDRVRQIIREEREKEPLEPLPWRQFAGLIEGIRTLLSALIEKGAISKADIVSTFQERIADSPADETGDHIAKVLGLIIADLRKPGDQH